MRFFWWTCCTGHTASTDREEFTLMFWRTESLIPMLNCGGLSCETTQTYFATVSLFQRCFQDYFSCSRLRVPNSFSVSELLLCYLHWKFFSNFTHIFMAIILMSTKEQSQKAKGVPPWLIVEVQLLSTLRHLASANRTTAQTGEMWVWFGLRCFCINYDLTGDFWWIYSQEVSYSRCIRGNVRGDLGVRAEEDSW